MMGKIFPGVNNYRLNRLFSSVRSCAVIKVLFRAYRVLSMYYNNLLDQHTKNNYRKCLATLFCTGGKHIRAVISPTVY